MKLAVAAWKEAVRQEEDPEKARRLLVKATEAIPASSELWLALARHGTPDQAREVLNQARVAVPTSHDIEIAAARLQKQTGDSGEVVVTKRAEAQKSVILTRQEWISEAEKCEDQGAIVACDAIIRETLGYDVNKGDDRRKLWMKDARSCIARGKYETARAIYACTLRSFASVKFVWFAAANLEIDHGSPEALRQLLENAAEACPRSEECLIELAKVKCQAGEIDGARRLLITAIHLNPDNETIWIAALMGVDKRLADEPREVFRTMRQVVGSERVWIKSVAFERQLGNVAVALDLVARALRFHSKTAKLWMMKGQLYENIMEPPQARDAYNEGIRACPTSVPLWLLASRLEEKIGFPVAARAVLRRARHAIPKNAELWTESVRVERRAKNGARAKGVMAIALQEVPNSGLLWSEKIWRLERRATRTVCCLEAMERVRSDATLSVTVARVIEKEGRLNSAMLWFEEAIFLDADLGDTWGRYLRFLMRHGTDEHQQTLISKCVRQQPRHGEIWQAVAKYPANASKTTEEILKIVVGLMR
ncbi:hypothetical protein MMC22_010048 [Lobaria immixta]|nr:hypothetical protein [Lobaria immixta]